MHSYFQHKQTTNQGLANFEASTCRSQGKKFLVSEGSLSLGPYGLDGFGWVVRWGGNQFFIYNTDDRKQLMEEDSDMSFHQIHDQWPNPNPESQQPQSLNKNNSRTQQSILELNQLNKAKQRFKTFLEEIGKIKHSPIREDIIAYCGGQKKAEKTIENFARPQVLIKKLDTRIQKMLKTKRIKRNWGEQDLKILIWIISKYSDLKNYDDLEKELTHSDWTFIASLIPGVTPQACMFKWLSIKKITLATHNWAKAESDILASIVSERIESNQAFQGQIKDWKEISQELYNLNQDQNKVYRNAKQCREHWTCYLSPNLKKGPWQAYQDTKLLKFIKDNKGLKKWSQIARHFEGRTENALKNRYTLIIDKLKKQTKNKGKPELQLISQYLEKTYVDQLTSNVQTMPNPAEDDISSFKNQGMELSPPTSKAKKEENTFDSNQTAAITPVRVQKFNLNDLQNMNMHFFKNIQPGVIESNGLFKKIASSTAIKELTPECFNKKEQSVRKQIGPFTLTPLARPFSFSH